MKTRTLNALGKSFMNFLKKEIQQSLFNHNLDYCLRNGNDVMALDELETGSIMTARFVLTSHNPTSDFVELLKTSIDFFSCLQ